MISLNGKLCSINNRYSWIQYLPKNISLPNLKGWYKLESLTDLEINFRSQTGTVNIVAGTNVISGNGTLFVSNDDIGKRIKIGSEEKWIVSVLSSTSLIVDSNFLTDHSFENYFYGYVSKWKNAINEMPDFVQNDINSQPFIKFLDNKLVIHFNSKRDSEYLILPTDYDLGKNQTFFFKCDNRKLVDFSDIFNSLYPEMPRITHSRATGKFYYYSIDNVSVFWNTEAFISDFISICCINKGNGLEIHNQNNINAGTVSNVGNPIIDKIIKSRFAIGNLPVNPNATYSFRGFFSELFIYDSVLNISQRGKLLHYLNTKKY